MAIRWEDALELGFDTTREAHSTKRVSIAGSSDDMHEPFPNLDAVVTYTAGGVGVKHVISGVAWSYAGGTPSWGGIKVEDGAGNKVFSLDIPAQGANHVQFPQPKAGTANTDMVITLAAGGADITGKVLALNHWLES